MSSSPFTKLISFYFFVLSIIPVLIVICIRKLILCVDDAMEQSQIFSQPARLQSESIRLLTYLHIDSQCLVDSTYSLNTYPHTIHHATSLSHTLTFICSHPHTYSLSRLSLQFCDPVCLFTLIGLMITT